MGRALAAWKRVLQTTGSRAKGVIAEDGRFSIGPLPAGEYLLRASRRGSYVTQPVTAHTGDSDIVLELPKVAGSIAIGTNDHHVRPVTQLFPRGRPDLSLVDTYGIHVHTCTFEDLEAGLYDAVMVTDDRRLGRIEGLVPTPDGTFGRVELAPCATLRVVFSGPESFALVEARANGSVYTSAIVAHGAARALSVPPGPVTLETYPLDSWSALPGQPRTREVAAALDMEPEILVP